MLKSNSINSITVSAGVIFGKPRIKGTRISVEQVLNCLAEGWTNKEIIKEFGLTESDIRAALKYAHSSISRVHFLTTDEKTTSA